jgi:Leucine-rich repeat (LRR) protein
MNRKYPTNCVTGLLSPLSGWLIWLAFLLLPCMPQAQTAPSAAPQPEPPLFDWRLFEKNPEPWNYDSVRLLAGYPESALDQEIEGKVVVSILVDDWGRYRRDTILFTEHPDFARAVAPHLPALRFRPAILQGFPTATWVSLSFHFQITDCFEKAERETFFSLEAALQRPSETCILKLEGEGLTEFPMEILQLPHLQFLSLQNNALTTLPSEITQLKELRFIDLRGTFITHLPPEITEMPQLLKIILARNPQKE